MILKAKVNERTWIKLIADNKKLIERIFLPGENLTWEAKDKFEIHIGNVWGVSFKLNDHPVDLVSTNIRGTNRLILGHDLTQ